MKNETLLIITYIRVRFIYFLIIPMLDVYVKTIGR